MFRTVLVAAASVLVAAMGAVAAEPSAPTVDYGRTVSIIGGCNDCHTAGYSEAQGVINPVTALKGNPVGYQGPCGHHLRNEPPHSGGRHERGCLA